jgi:hypothetical protein
MGDRDRAELSWKRRTFPQQHIAVPTCVSKHLEFWPKLDDAWTLG